MKPLSSRELMRREWESSSPEEKVVLLVTAYEAFASQAATRMRKDFILPASHSYRNLLRTPVSSVERRRVTRMKSIFRRVVALVDRYGLFYRDFVAYAFDTWRTPRRPQGFYRLRRKVPAAFPLPQHLLAEDTADQCAGFRNSRAVQHDDPAERDRRREEVELRESQHIVRNLLERNPARFPGIEAVLKDPFVFSQLSGPYLRDSKEFEELFRSGFYLKQWGQERNAGILKFLSSTTRKA